MPYTPLKITIPSPCHEDWNQMHPVSGATARHCDSCAKNVVDFTGFTDAQVHAYVRANQGKLCGRFRPDQLERPLRAASTPTRHPLQVAAAAAGLLVAATGCETAKTVETNERFVEVVGEQDALLGAISSTVPLPTIALQPAVGKVKVEDVRTTNQAPPAVLTGDTLITLPPLSIVEETVGEVETIEGKIIIEAAPKTPQLTCSSGDIPAAMEDDGILVGDISIAEIPEEIMLNDLDSLPPIPPPPMVMGMVIADLPEPTGIDWVKDTVRSILPTLPLEKPSSHLRPRPTEAPSSPTVTVYPNPFVDHLKIDLELPEAKTVTVELLGLTGRIIHRQKWEAAAGKQTLTITPRRRKLKQALYYLRMTDGDRFNVVRTVTR